MKYNFDQSIERHGTLSYKWDCTPVTFPANPDALPFWVADMDFAVPQPIVDAIVKRAAHPIYGYSSPSPKAVEATLQWQQNRNGWKVEPEWLTFSNGVVPALSAAVAAFTQPEQGVIIQQPVYYPFRESIENNGRKVVDNQLVYHDGRWNINFEQLEVQAADPQTKLLLLCHPLNPVSRVLEKEELQRIAQICHAHDVIVMVDEIHGDLIYKHAKFHSYAAVNEPYLDHMVVCTAPSKTFNIAGLQMSAVIIPNQELRQTFTTEMTKRVYIPNLFGSVAYEAAYSDPECENYLDQLIDYLWNNYLFVNEFLTTHLPAIQCQKPDATYLLWLDCRQLKLNDAELDNFFLKDAGLALDSGKWFGPMGTGYMRLNIGCPKHLLEKALNQLLQAYQARGF